MRKEEIAQLLKKYRDGTCTEQEKAFLDSWYIQYEAAEPNELSFAEREEDLDQVWQSLDASYRKTRRLTMWRQAAAALLILIISSIGIYLYTNKDQVPSQQLVVNDIAPGGNRATLTLAGGQTIALSEAQSGIIVGSENISYQDGAPLVVISNEEARRGEIPLLAVATPRGGQYQIQLPDGTKVWLNAASSLKYPASFAGLGERRVELRGEAYFEVAKDAEHPFIVQSDKQTVKVLGTHFNISAYPSEALVRTTLAEGSVKVTQKGSNEAQILRPGEQAVAGNNGLRIRQVDPSDALAWKNGLFQFNEEPLESIMHKLARWYDVEVIFENQKIKQYAFVGVIDRFSKVSEVLDMLQLTGKVHFRIEGRKIIVSAKE